MAVMAVTMTRPDRNPAPPTLERNMTKAELIAALAGFDDDVEVLIHGDDPQDFSVVWIGECHDWVERDGVWVEDRSVIIPGFVDLRPKRTHD
jgi:hypothetical protein